MNLLDLQPVIISNNIKNDNLLKRNGNLIVLNNNFKNTIYFPMHADFFIGNLLVKFDNMSLVFNNNDNGETTCQFLLESCEIKTKINPNVNLLSQKELLKSELYTFHKKYSTEEFNKVVKFITTKLTNLFNDDNLIIFTQLFKQHYSEYNVVQLLLNYIVKNNKNPIVNYKIKGCYAEKYNNTNLLFENINVEYNHIAKECRIKLDDYYNSEICTEPLYNYYSKVYPIYEASPEGFINNLNRCFIDFFNNENNIKTLRIKKMILENLKKYDNNISNLLLDLMIGKL